MSPYSIKLVDTPELLDLCLEDIAAPSVSKLVIDLEGISLSRNGTISLLQILSNLSTSVWVIDIFNMGAEAFSHVSPHGQSLKAVLENSHTLKVSGSPRNRKTL
jgi:exonuclease 3'-5' domain-containing protein 1